jgi:transcriptional antiterminator NusG
MIFVVKVIINKEEHAADMIAHHAEKKGLEIYSVVKPHGLRGYIFLESLDTETAEMAIANVPYVRGLISKQITYAEIETMLKPVAATVSIEKDDIVEMLTEPFKREKAKVIRVDKIKEEVVVELLEAAVRIPITVKLDNVKVIRRTKDEKDDEDEK